MEIYSFGKKWLMVILQSFSEQIQFTRTKLVNFQCYVQPTDSLSMYNAPTFNK